MSIVVRPAQLADVDAVRFIGAATWPSTYGSQCASYVMRGLDTYWSEEAIAAAIAAGSIDVVETLRGVVGMVHVEDLANDIVMWKLYVIPSEQRTGLGRALVSSAKARTRSRGCDLLTEYAASNGAVGSYYEREGFEPTSAPWPGSDAVWLRWSNRHA